MKYPQLVSNRAINEISDWLITRLEELDIEQPGVYSRLLLSLLQTSFKVDSAELLDILQLKDIEKPHKLLKKSNEELQRLAAVESLVEVSAEGNKLKIINLVNELHSKLRLVEDSSFEENVSSTAVTVKHSNFTKKLKKISSKKKDVIGEPDKNYYDVFPALSRIEKRANLPSLTTIVSSSDHVDESLKSSEKSSTVKLSKSQLCWSTLMSSVKEDASSSLKLVEGKAATKQRKKRRNVTRNGKLLNIIDVQYSSNNAKNYDVYHNATFLPKASKSNTKKHQRNCLVSSKYQKGSVVARSKNFSANDQLLKKKATSTVLEKSVAPWDMDFRDHWEMDQDLISEFLLQQKKKKKDGEVEFVRHRFEAADNSKDVDEGDIEEDTMLKCLPDRLFHDDDEDDESDDEGGDDGDAKEDGDEMNKDSLTLLKMKFDANVKALWSDGAGDDSMKSSAFGFEYNNNNSDLSSSYVNDSSALSLFNFSNQLRSLGVITPSDPHFYIFNKSSNTSSSANSTLVSDSNNKKSSYQSLQQSNSSSLISPAVGNDKFIKLGTNLHSSIWSDCEQAQEDENVDHKIDSEENFEVNQARQMPSIGAEIKNSTAFNNDEDLDDAEISLFNHSDASAFKRFKPNLMPTIIRANYHPINNTKMDHALMSSSFDGENLLTSERTHFSPIICDGHNFAINNDWNKIKYERSPSGCLMHNNKRYMKWCLPITNVIEAAACASGGAIDLDAMENEESYCEFSIKFLVQTDNEKGCQTDMNDFIRLGSQGLMEINEKYLKRNIFTDYGYMGFSDNNMWQYHQEDSNDYTMISSSNQKPPSPAEVYDDPYESWSNLKPEMLQNDHLRLLKDELRVDCDEIMSVIQNLYITGGDVCEDDEPEAQDDFEDMNHFYTDMLDDSVETFDDCKFYDGGNRSKVDDDRFTPNLIEEQQFENFSDITRWSWSEDFNKDQEKYLNLLKWIQTTIFKESSRSDSNNNMEHEEQRKSSNRKRRHSTCQNYLGTSPKAPLIEENCNLFVDSAKLLKVNIERSLFMPNIEGKERHEHYRNILQQHILIKQMEHTRPLTR